MLTRAERSWHVSRSRCLRQQQQRKLLQRRLGLAKHWHHWRLQHVGQAEAVVEAAGRGGGEEGEGVADVWEHGRAVQHILSMRA